MQRIGIITDTMLTPVTYYNAYFRTPEFFAQDIRYQLLKRNIEVVPLDETVKAMKKLKITQNDLTYLQSLQQGYNIDYTFLRKIAKETKVSKIIIITVGIDIQRDFLKNTLWNVLNVAGWDVVNPTHRVNVYAGFIDVYNENMLWESIYAKNIRNNKMKNLDTTISNNYEGMLRLKEYSKFISPDIAYNVKMKYLNENNIEAAENISIENLTQYSKDKHNIGVKKELSESGRKKWEIKKSTGNSKKTKNTDLL